MAVQNPAIHVWNGSIIIEYKEKKYTTKEKLKHA
jgi:hypothetical protein